MSDRGRVHAGVDPAEENAEPGGDDVAQAARERPLQVLGSGARIRRVRYSRGTKRSEAEFMQ
jgi:hypothetical protein